MAPRPGMRLGCETLHAVPGHGPAIHWLREYVSVPVRLESEKIEWCEMLFIDLRTKEQPLHRSQPVIFSHELKSSLLLIFFSVRIFFRKEHMDVI